MFENVNSGIVANDPLKSMRSQSAIRVRLVRTPMQMQSVIDVRQRAYLRTPSQARLVSMPEREDADSTAVVLLANDELTGAAVGTIRIHSGNEYIAAHYPELKLPKGFDKERICFVSRFAVDANTSKVRMLVRSLLIKACFQVCAAMQGTQVLIVAPAKRARMFRQIGFDQLLPESAAIDLAAYGAEKIVPLVASTLRWERRLRFSKSPLHEFVFHRFHPEIEVFQSISSGIMRKAPSNGQEDNSSAQWIGRVLSDATYGLARNAQERQLL